MQNAASGLRSDAQRSGVLQNRCRAQQCASQPMQNAALSFRTDAKRSTFAGVPARSLGPPGISWALGVPRGSHCPPDGIKLWGQRRGITRAWKGTVVGRNNRLCRRWWTSAAGGMWRREKGIFSGRNTMRRRFESRRAVREVKPDEKIGYEKRIPLRSLVEHVLRHDSNRALLCSVRRSVFPFSARAVSWTPR